MSSASEMDDDEASERSDMEMTDNASDYPQPTDAELDEFYGHEAEYEAAAQGRLDPALAADAYLTRTFSYMFGRQAYDFTPDAAAGEALYPLPADPTQNTPLATFTPRVAAALAAADSHRVDPLLITMGPLLIGSLRAGRADPENAAEAAANFMIRPLPPRADGEPHIPANMFNDRYYYLVQSQLRNFALATYNMGGEGTGRGYHSAMINAAQVLRDAAHDPNDGACGWYREFGDALHALHSMAISPPTIAAQGDAYDAGNAVVDFLAARDRLIATDGRDYVAMLARLEEIMNLPAGAYVFLRRQAHVRVLDLTAEEDRLRLSFTPPVILHREMWGAFPQSEAVSRLLDISESRTALNELQVILEHLFLVRRLFDNELF